ncbi:MAG: pilus assembly protein TadG-related protein [Acidobacteriota bacterium]
MNASSQYGMRPGGRRLKNSAARGGGDSLLRGEGGQVLPLTALSLGVLMAFLALALDVAQFLYTKRQLQIAADAAALAGAIEIDYCNGAAGCTLMKNAVQAAVQENGWTGFSLVTQCGSLGSSGLTVQMNNGPCALGAGDPNQGNANFVEVVASEPRASYFAGVFGFPAVRITSRAEASLDSSPYCAYILNPSASDALLLNGNATLTATCGVMVDSNSTQAAVFNGSTTVSTSAIDVVGKVLNNGNNSINPAPATGVAALTNPLANLPMPTVGSCTQSNYISNGGSSVTLTPGTYCGTTIFNGGNYTVTFNPGTYVFTGGMIANGGVTLQGTGVTFYFSSGSLTMNGSSHVALSAPTTGTYAGMLYLQNSTDSSTVILNGDTTSAWQGAFYAPDAQLTLNGGNKNAAYTLFVVNTLTENGNDDFAIGSDYSSLPHGKSPLQGPKSNLME